MSSAVHNLSQRAGHYHYLATGGFRVVRKGVYTRGPRKGEPCVSKTFKTGPVYEEVFFTQDIKAVEQAQKIIDAFNEEGAVRATVWLNHPEVWVRYNEGDDDEGDWTGPRCLVEPFIEDFQKFNSNSGLAFGGSDWHLVMQALSHFSYHKTGGQMVLCDLQGGIINGGVVLTDPVILSRTRSFGLTDLGPDGISNFFAYHQCNKWCRAHWHQPRDPVPLLRACPGTSMALPPGRGA